MGLTISDALAAALAKTVKEPNIVLKIDGIGTIFGASIIQEYGPMTGGAVLGDSDLDPAEYADIGLVDIDDQKNIITFDGTSTSIKQTLNVDKGQGGSISTLSVALMDDGYASELISPGAIVADVLQRQCLVYYGFNGTSFPQDYSVVFRGLITDVVADAGKIVLQINHPDDKKRSNIFKKIDAKLEAALTATTPVIELDTVENFLTRVLGPDATYDSSFESYVRIDDEVIKFVTAQAAASPVVTIDIPTDVFTSTAHGLVADEPHYYSTTGALPTGVVAGTTYYARDITTNTYKIAAAPGGAAINVTGAQSGVHTLNISLRLVTLTRGALGTTAATHSADTTVSTYYRLQGNCVDLALKILASGNVSAGASIPLTTGLEVTSVNVGGDESEANSLFFEGVDVQEQYGIVIGDWLYSSSGATNGANNVSSKQILDIIRGATGDFVVIDNVTFVDEVSGSIVCSFISQYATLPDGLRMRPDEIDVLEHERLYRLFLSAFEYDFYIKDGIEDAAEFLEEQIYSPVAAYSLPRKARASLGYHSAPIPTQTVVTFDESNIKSPSKIMLKRSTSRYFQNEIVYRYDEHPIEDKFETGYVTISADSKNQIPGANKTFTIDARGLRTTLLGSQIAASQSLRRLSRYQFGAELISFETTLEAGFTIEIGDVIIVDGSNLFLPDIKNATKGMAARFFEVQNKDFQLKTGAIKIDAVDTNFDGAARYGLIAPASEIVSGASGSEFVIQESFNSPYGTSEFKKWKRFSLPVVRVYNSDGTIVGDTILIQATSNTIRVSPALGFTPTAGMIMTLSPYNTTDVTAQVKRVYCHMSDTVFDDGSLQFTMI